MVTTPTTSATRNGQLDKHNKSELTNNIAVAITEEDLVNSENDQDLIFPGNAKKDVLVFQDLSPIKNRDDVKMSNTKNNQVKY